MFYLTSLSARTRTDLGVKANIIFNDGAQDLNLVASSLGSVNVDLKI